ncbi:hypothetical protein D3C87_1841530 [compost metagenome]
MQRNGGIIDAADAADARADQNACAFLVFLGFWFNPGILDGLGGSGHGVDDEIVDLALFLGFHPLVGIVLAIGIIPAGQPMRDLARDVIDLEFVDTLGSTLACQDIGPSGLHSATKGRDKPHSGDDDST